MRLDEYLEAIKNCPEEVVEFDKEKKHMLSTKFGIGDNFPILMNGDFKDTINFLTGSDFFITRREERENYTVIFMSYSPGTVELQAWSVLSMNVATAEFQSVEHHNRQISNYNHYVMLHSYSKKKIPNMSDVRAIALVLGIIGEYALKTETPLCLPQSKGSAHLGDYSRIVYFP